jgi:hypothetical protein
MKRPKWLGGGSKPPKLHPELPPPTGPLREFVYLDEISVISLVASRRGAVPEAVTRSEAARDTAEISSKLAANAAVVKAELGSKLASESTKGVTTVAKSVVQTTFKDLREIEDEDLLLRVPRPGDPPTVLAATDLLRLATSAAGAGWIVDASELQRGKPIEVEVELETDPLFRTSTAISEVLSLMGEISDLVSGVTASELAEMKQFNKVLERLLAGLVPLRGRIVDYRLVAVRDHELIVHRRIVEDLGLECCELTLVGVAARDLFWKDLRLVLFSGARYTVFCRMARTGVHRAWNPVKLAEALREIAPPLAEQLQQLGPQLQNLMRSGVLAELPAGGRESMMRQALIVYGQAGAAACGATFSEAEMEAADLLTPDQCARHLDVESQREAFAAVTSELRDRFEREFSSKEALDLRWAALTDAGLVEGSDRPSPANVALAVGSEQRLLEIEPVAIYW